MNRQNLPLSEYPRPNLKREDWLSLNGDWEYAIVHGEQFAYSRNKWRHKMRNKKRNKSLFSFPAPFYTGPWEGKILVPFSPETSLSGVERMLLPGDILYYRKTFRLPEDFLKKRLVIHFEGVDQECRLWCNGKEVGSHKGGFLAFSFDLTSFLREEENEIVLAVQDATEFLPHARGKQKLIRKGRFSALFYTPQSGIWKSVWLESLPEDYIQRLCLRPDWKEASLEIFLVRNPEKYQEGKKKPLPLSLRIFDREGESAFWEGEMGAKCRLKLSLKHRFDWSPEEPHLYSVEIRMGEDRVSSYFGLREIRKGVDKNGVMRFFLNGSPYFFKGVLDQGYWPQSLMTPPSDAALLYDIQKLKSLGFNTIRKHCKVEDGRFYYHCDRLGMAVWQDMPNGGGEYNHFFIIYLPNIFRFFGRIVKDNLYRLYGREDREGKKQYRRDLRGMVRQLQNHPGILMWVPFNEGWGQFDAKKATALLRRLDPGRLVNEACGWFDQGGGDVYSIHNYLWKLRIPEPAVSIAGGRVVALTEFGGFSRVIPGHSCSDKEFGYGKTNTKKELTNSYRRLFLRDVFPHIKKGLSAIIYTQTSDVETEQNGFMTYDRKIDKFNEATVRELNEKISEVFKESVEGGSH